jgi:D-3-phosphoglycerate dehydrogenase / 2-oxoglutarate reductase
MKSDTAKTSYPKDKIRVVLLEGVHARGAAMFRSEGFHVESLSASPDDARLLKLATDCHVLGVRSKTQVPRHVLDASPRLLAVGCFCIGTDQVDLGHARGKGIPVFNAPFSNTRSVAELTIAEVIALSRQMFPKSMQMHAGQWDKSASGAHEVRGRTLGIVGYGHIGSQVSVLAEAMGMRVIYYDIVPKLPLGNARSVRSLAELLRESDFVTLHVPATQATSGLMGSRQFKMMKPGAFLINNARGGVVHVPALVSALKDGTVGGAAVDVFPHEPASKGERFDSPLCGLPNVILTPHIGGSTEEAQETIASDVAEKLIKFVNVGTTTGAVNVPEVELPPQHDHQQQDEPGMSERDGDLGTGDRKQQETPRKHRILHFHRNVPGVLRQVHARIAGLGANVSAEYLRTNEQIGYMVLDVDPTNARKVVEEIRQVPETIRVRVLW